MDLSNMPREEIEDMIRAGEGELARRQTIGVFNDELAALQGKYRAALGIEPIDWWPWEEPEYALDAPGRGDTVEEGGYFYRSLVPCNMFKPSEGVGYRRVMRNGAPLSWVEPLRSHDGYAAGERAIRIGVTYESVEDGNTSMPSPENPAWSVAEEPEESEE